jgi:hypothetical protein
MTTKMATFFQLVARGLEGPMSEGAIASFGSLWEAERALMNARYNEMSVTYWIVELPVATKPVAYLHTRERAGKWQATLTETADAAPCFFGRSFATPEQAIADRREWLSRNCKVRFDRIEVV